MGTHPADGVEAAKAAETEAFKRAALKFGVGLHLYEDDASHAAGGTAAHASPSRQPQWATGTEMTGWPITGCTGRIRGTAAEATEQTTGDHTPRRRISGHAMVWAENLRLSKTRLKRIPCPLSKPTSQQDKKQGRNLVAFDQTEGSSRLERR